MVKQLGKSVLGTVLVLFLSFNHVQGGSILSGVSWIFRGTTQQNNTVLTFNMYDTLNLICRTQGSQVVSKVIFVISKGSIPTNAIFSTTTGILTVPNIGTLIYSDVDGIQPGFENFGVWGPPYNAAAMAALAYEYRYITVGTLRPSDSGTYHCSARYVNFYTSGGLTLIVNTKQDQARSTRASVNVFLTYSSALLGASKLVL